MELQEAEPVANAFDRQRTASDSLKGRLEKLEEAG